MLGKEARVDPSAGGHQDLGGRLEGAESHQQTTEGRVRGARAKPGGGDATTRRFVESGRAACGVRVWQHEKPTDPPGSEVRLLGRKKKNNEERILRERERERERFVTVDSNVHCRPEKYIKMC